MYQSQMDVLAVVRGMHVPVVLHPVGPGAYKFLGEPYVNIVMDSGLLIPEVGGPPRWESLLVP